MRYALCWDKTINGNLEKLPRGRFLYRKYFDNVSYTCKGGDTLWSIAAKYYGPSFANASMLFWIIGDFQTIPIVDPTLVFDAGATLVIPSVRVVRLFLDDPSREPEFEAW
jgi:hypothetical protein